MAGQKRKLDIQKKLRDFPNTTLAELESAIVVKRHLICNLTRTIVMQTLFNTQAKGYRFSLDK
jgi:hypothetical protein